MSRSLDWISAHPWLMTPEALQRVIAIAERTGDPMALVTKDGQRLENTRNVRMRDGVAVVPITGPIFRYANLFTAISGATSTEVLAKDIREAIDNKLVSRIVLDIDSPGGEATGINELAEVIYQGRSKKPIVAYIGGHGASAAYWLASAASSIYADATAIVGSIGVVMSHTDTRKRDERDGVERLEIVSSASPDKRVDPMTEAGRAKVQAIVDAMADVFISAVARNRSTTPANVKKSYGQGGVLVGEQAVRSGMIDGLSSLEAVIAKRATPSATGRNSASVDATNATTGFTPWDKIIAAVRSANAVAPAATGVTNEGAIEQIRREEKRPLVQHISQAEIDAMNKPAAATSWDAVVAKAIEKQSATLSPDAIYKSRRNGAFTPPARVDAQEVYRRRRAQTADRANVQKGHV